MLEKLNLTYAIYSFLGIYALSVGNQFWTNYQINEIETRIQEQIKGKLDDQAQLLIKMDEKIGLTNAKMVDLDELERRTNQALSSLSEDTQKRIKQYQRDTNAQVSNLSTRIRRVDAHITEGLADVGQKVKVKTPPPKKWGGVKKQDVAWCKEDPLKCDTFPIKWRYPSRTNPIATFSSDNIFAGKFELKTSYKLRVTTVGFRDKKGIVENQAIFFDIGYLDEKTKEFKKLQSFEIKHGDNDESDQFFHTAAIDPTLFNGNLKWFEPTVLLGVSFAPTLSSSSSLDFRTGLTVGGALINFRGGEIRIGANGVISPDILGVGAFSSYHTKLFGKSFNLAPMVGVLLDQNLQTSMQIGLVYQLY